MEIARVQVDSSRSNQHGEIDAKSRHFETLRRNETHMGVAVMSYR